MDFQPLAIGSKTALSKIVNNPMTRRELSAALSISALSADTRVKNLLKLGYLTEGSKGILEATELGVQASAHAPTKAGHTGVYARATPGSGKPASYEPYVPIELRRPVGVLPERFDAFSLPSRIGNTLHYPDGRIETI